MKKYLKRIITTIIILTCIVIIAYLFISNPGKAKNETGEKYNINLENSSVVFPVKVIKVEKRTYIRWIKSAGIIRSSQEAEIFAKLSGSIIRSNIHEGSQVVKKGVLLELDDREYKIALSRANNELMKAQFEYLVLKSSSGENAYVKNNEKINLLFENYQKALLKYEKGEMDFDEYLNIRNLYELSILSTGVKKDTALQSRSGLLTAINELKRAELDYSYTKIRAPFSGVIADYDLSTGAYVTPSKPVCKVVDILNLKVEVGVLESDVKMLSIGRSVDVIVPALGEEKYKGKIISVSPIIDPDKKTCRATVGLFNPSGHHIKPGMYANCVIEGDVFPDRLLIPKKALLVRNERKLVFTIGMDRDSSSAEPKAQWTYVTTGLENEDWIEVLSGLNAGDTLIIDGHYTLSHNATVRIEQ